MSKTDSYEHILQRSIKVSLLSFKPFVIFSQNFRRLHILMKLTIKLLLLKLQWFTNAPSMRQLSNQVF